MVGLLSALKQHTGHTSTDDFKLIWSRLTIYAVSGVNILVKLLGPFDDFNIVLHVTILSELYLYIMSVSVKVSEMAKMSTMQPTYLSETLPSALRGLQWTSPNHD